MRATVIIPLRYFHSLGGNFTLPVQRKPITATLYPFSLKKLMPTGPDKLGTRPKVLEAELSTDRV
jgi:hypothetical protein